jgi:hypothetical protein
MIELDLAIIEQDDTVRERCKGSGMALRPTSE